MICALLAATLAGPTTIGVGVGVAAEADPIAAVSLGVGLRFADRAWARVAGTVLPDWGRRAAWSHPPSTAPRVVVGPISRPYAEVGIDLGFVPIDGLVGTRSREVALALSGYAGLGVVNTHDDLESFDAVGDPDARATRDQWHPSQRLGLSLRVGDRRRPTLVIEARWTTWVEVIDSVTLDVEGLATSTVGVEIPLAGRR